MTSKHTRRKMDTKKKVAAATAGVLAVAMLAGGAFAWSDFSQQATNRFRTLTENDVQLHDDYDPTPDGKDADGNPYFNKDVYVENTGTQPIVVRVRLDEMFQVGSNLLVGGNAADKTTWDIHEFPATTNIAKPGGLVTGDREADDAIAPYYEWYMSGEFKHYKPGLSESGDPVVEHSDDPNDPNSQHTLDAAAVITMAAYAANPGEYTGEGELGCWVLDTDGWAYWSQVLQPSDATNLLMDKVTQIGAPDDNSQYNINVILQAAGRSDVGDFTTAPNSATPDGEDLINRLAADHSGDGGGGGGTPIGPEIPDGPGFNFLYDPMTVAPGATVIVRGYIDGEAAVGGAIDDPNADVTYSLQAPVTDIAITPEGELTIGAGVAEDITFVIVATPTNAAPESFDVAKTVNGTVVAVADEDDEITDAILRLRLDGDGDGVLSTSDLADLVTLDLSNLTTAELADLDLGVLVPQLEVVLPSLTGLTGLNLSGLGLDNTGLNDVLTALLGTDRSGLKLLDLSGNTIGDGTGLDILDNLTGLGGLLDLNLADTGLTGTLTDILDLDNLTGLTGLDLSGNLLEDIDLTDLLPNLTSLGAGGMAGLLTLNAPATGDGGLLNLDLLGSENLLELNLAGADLVGINAIKGWTALTELTSLNLNGVSTLLGGLNLAGKPLLGGLIGSTGEQGILDLTGLTGLTSLGAGGLSSLTDIAGLEGLTGLTNLVLSGSGLTGALDLTGLSKLTSLDVSRLIDLTSLDLTGLTGLTSILGLDTLTGLTDLLLGGTGLSGLLDLTNLSLLENLDVSGLNLAGLDLGGLANLTKLDLTGVTGLVGETLNLLGSGLINENAVLPTGILKPGAITGLTGGLLTSVLDILGGLLGILGL